MDTLPLEMLYLVLDHCAPTHLANLRLVNKIFATAAAPLIFESQTICCTLRSFEHFHALASSKYASHVRSLVLHTCLPQGMPSEKAILRYRLSSWKVHSSRIDMFWTALHVCNREAEQCLWTENRLAFVHSIARLPNLRSIAVCKLSRLPRKMMDESLAHDSIFWTTMKHKLQWFRIVVGASSASTNPAYDDNADQLNTWALAALTHRSAKQFKPVRSIVLQSSRDGTLPFGTFIDWQEAEAALAELETLKLLSSRSSYDCSPIKPSAMEWSLALSQTPELQNLTLELGMMPLPAWTLHSQPFVHDATLSRAAALPAWQHLRSLEILAVTVNTATLQVCLEYSRHLKFLKLQEISTDDVTRLLIVVHETTKLQDISITHIRMPTAGMPVPRWFFTSPSSSSMIKAWLLHQDDQEPCFLINPGGLEFLR